MARGARAGRGDRPGLAGRAAGRASSRVAAFVAAARHAAAGALAAALLSGCGGGAPAPAGSAAALLEPLAATDTTLAFVAGGAPGDLLARCGTRQERLMFGNETLTLAPADAHRLLATWRDAKTGAERRLGLGASGPLLVDGEQAWALPGWPAGATAGAAAFSPDGRHLAVTLSGGERKAGVGIWPVPLRAPRFAGGADAGGGTLLAWSADARTLALVDGGNRLLIFRLPKLRAAYELAFEPGVEGRITGLDLSPDGDWYVVAANAVILRAWKLPFMNTQLKPWGRIKTVFFAGEVGSVVTVDETNTAIRWTVNYGDVRVGASRHLDGLDRAAAPAGGLYLAGVDSAGVVRAWRSGDLAPLELAGGERPFCR